jgi:hypothetical protein
MTREVVTLRDIKILNQELSGERVNSESTYPERKDAYFDRLFKYIPAELVAGYIFVLGLIKQLTDADAIKFLQWLLFIVFCILTPLYLWRIQKVLKVQQHIISLASFAVWCFALGGPFAMYGWYNPVYGEVLLPVFTLIVAVWEAK